MTLSMQHRPADAEITKQVRQAILWDARVSPASI